MASIADDKPVMSSTAFKDTDSRLSDAAVITTPTSAPIPDRTYVVPDGVDEKKLMRKVDLHIIPWLSVLYLLSFLDRSAIGNAKLYKLPDDLHMIGNQFNIASAVFFFPYAGRSSTDAAIR